MYADIFAILAPIGICTLIGYCWARSGVPYEGEFVTRLVMNIGAPCLVVGTLSKAQMPANDLLDILSAAAVVLVVTGLTAFAFTPVKNAPRRFCVASGGSSFLFLDAMPRHGGRPSCRQRRRRWRG